MRKILIQVSQSRVLKSRKEEEFVYEDLKDEFGKFKFFLDVPVTKMSNKQFKCYV